MRFEAEQLAKTLRHYAEEGIVTLPAVVEHSLVQLEEAIDRRKKAIADAEDEDEKAAQRELRRIARMAHIEPRDPRRAFAGCFEPGTVTL